MQPVRIRLELITPLFMAGADGKTPELRPPSIKGMMRFWWRAVKGIDDSGKMQKEEEKVFGGTGDVGKSKVSLKVNLIIKPLDINEEEKGRLTGKHKGLGYLLYSVNLGPRKFINPGYKFELILCSSDKKALREVVASLWCAVYLGGFGTRARRGAGNMIVSDIKGIDDILLDFSPRGPNPDEVGSWLIKNYASAVKLISGERPENFVTNYSNLSFSRFIISNHPINSWVEALNSVGNIFEDFRFGHRNDVFDSAVFGLPVRHGNKRMTVGAKLNNNEIIRRRSSLIFKILRVEGKYYWLVLRLAGEFLPEGGVLKDSRGKTQKPDYRLIDQFWGKLKEEGKEKILSKPQILDEVVKKIKAQVNPEKVIFFGSKARGDAHKVADIDIVVETEKSVGMLDIVAPAVDIVNLKDANDELREKIKREGVEIQ